MANSCPKKVHRNLATSQTKIEIRLRKISKTVKKNQKKVGKMLVKVDIFFFENVKESWEKVSKK